MAGWAGETLSGTPSHVRLGQAEHWHALPHSGLGQAKQLIPGFALTYLVRAVQNDYGSAYWSGWEARGQESRMEGWHSMTGEPQTLLHMQYLTHG
jgi:hypothetical protein